MRLFERFLRPLTQYSRSFYTSFNRWQNVMYVFDRDVKRLQRNHTATSSEPQIFDYLREEIASRLADRVCDISRKFTVAVDLGCGRGYLSNFLTSDSVDTLVRCDSAIEVLKQAVPSADVPVSHLSFDEESFPFRPNSVDLVIACLSLHWINDLPGLFQRILSSLKNDGCFLGAIASADTLYELRVALQLAELERLGGFSPHISPFTDNADMGELLQRAGFNLISLDVDELVIHYPDMFCLMDDLRGMGESNAAFNRPKHLHKDVLLAAASIYNEMFSVPRENGQPGERCIPATYRFLHFIGWKPDPSQRQPLPRGSAQYSFRDISRIDELVKQGSEDPKS